MKSPARYSARPCPKGCSSSAGLAARVGKIVKCVGNNGNRAAHQSDNQLDATKQNVDANAREAHELPEAFAGRHVKNFFHNA